MSLGYSGPSSSGKSTLAAEVARVCGWPLLEFDTTGIVAELGLSPVASHTIEDRLKVQQHILTRFEEITQAHKKPFVATRTPIDMIAYMLGEVAMHGTSDELGLRITALVDEALAMADRTFLAIITVRGLGSYERDPKRPPANPAYHLHYEMLLEGASARLRHVEVYRLMTPKHEQRVELSLQTIKQIMSNLEAARQHRLFC